MKRQTTNNIPGTKISFRKSARNSKPSMTSISKANRRIRVPVRTDTSLEFNGTYLGKPAKIRMEGNCMSIGEPVRGQMLDSRNMPIIYDDKRSMEERIAEYLARQKAGIPVEPEMWLNAEQAEKLEKLLLWEPTPEVKDVEFVYEGDTIEAALFARDTRRDNWNKTMPEVQNG